jgi:hypothetical protein
MMITSRSLNFTTFAQGLMNNNTLLGMWIGLMLPFTHVPRLGGAEEEA